MTINEPWADRAACKNHADPEIFFPERGSCRQAKEAKKICLACPVQADCLEYALTHKDAEGSIWGGTTYNERKRLRAGRPRQPREQCHKGHDLGLVGRWACGRCAQCGREWDRSRRRGGEPA